MTTSIPTPAFTRVNPALTPVRVAATSNVAGTYYNGPSNSGVGATLTLATGALTIDSVAIGLGDRVILTSQTAALQNGIYVCSQAGSASVGAVLLRTPDFQSIEHMQLGFFVPVYAGTANKGTKFTLVEPRPSTVGVDNIVFA